MSRYAAIFFDLDGTLRSNQPDGFQAFIEYAARVGIALTPDQIETCERAVHHYWADGALVADHLARYDERGFWVNYNQTLLDAMGLHDVDGVAEKIQDQFDHYAPQDVVFADTPVVLGALKRAGYILGLVSNRDGDLGSVAMRYGIQQFFTFCLSGGQAHCFKPDPGIFQQALQLAGNMAATDVLYVGDNYYADIVGALKAGMDALLLDPRDVFRDYYPKRVKALIEVLSVLDVTPEAHARTEEPG